MARCDFSLFPAHCCRISQAAHKSLSETFDASLDSMSQFLQREIVYAHHATILAEADGLNRLAVIQSVIFFVTK